VRLQANIPNHQTGTTAAAEATTARKVTDLAQIARTSQVRVPAHERLAMPIPDTLASVKRVR
jgi:hypothetical protein